MATDTGLYHYDYHAVAAIECDYRNYYSYGHLFALRSYDWCDVRHDASANPWSKCATKKPISRWNRVDKHLTASIGFNWNRACHHDNVYFAKQLLKDGC